MAPHHASPPIDPIYTHVITPVTQARHHNAMETPHPPLTRTPHSHTPTPRTDVQRRTFHIHTRATSITSTPVTSIHIRRPPHNSAQPSHAPPPVLQPGPLSLSQQTPTRRKISFLAPTPSAKRWRVVHPSPNRARFRVSGNKERTQPLSNHRSAAAPTLHHRLANLHATTHAPTAAMHALLAHSPLDPTALLHSLFAHVRQRADNLFIVTLYTPQPNPTAEDSQNRIGVFATPAMWKDYREQVKQEAASPHADSWQDAILFIPEPWFVTRVHDIPQVQWLVTPVSLSIIDKHRIPPSTHLVLNKAAAQRLPIVQQPESTPKHTATATLTNNTHYNQFSNISPHHYCVSVTISVVIRFPDHQLAIIADTTQQLALLQFASTAVPDRASLVLEHIYVLPNRISVEAILNIYPQPQYSRQFKSKLQRYGTLLVLSVNPT